MNKFTAIEWTRSEIIDPTGPQLSIRGAVDRWIQEELNLSVYNE